MPDFSSLNFGDSRARDRLAGILESVIRNFEPRLDKVEVEVDERDQDKSRSMIHYRIRAKLKVEPIPQPVAFDTVLELGNKTFLIMDEGG